MIEVAVPLPARNLVYEIVGGTVCCAIMALKFKFKVKEEVPVEHFEGPTPMPDVNELKI